MAYCFEAILGKAKVARKLDDFILNLILILYLILLRSLSGKVNFRTP